MPVYRQRDRVDQLRERNDVIFDACVDRMHAGAAMGIFPEGNHNPFPSLRALKGGLAEMLARAARRHPELKSIQVVPIGLDYEHYLDWRRRFRAARRVLSRPPRLRPAARRGWRGDRPSRR